MLHTLYIQQCKHKESVAIHPRILRAYSFGLNHEIVTVSEAP